MSWSLAFANLALADVPPPADYVETCTVEKHSAPGTTCTTCPGYHGGREPCEKLEAEGYKSVCRTYGASTWTEVLCKADAGASTPGKQEAPVPGPPAPSPAGGAGCNTLGPQADVAPGGGCGCALPTPSPSGWPLLVLAALARRRRC